MFHLFASYISLVKIIIFGNWLIVSPKDYGGRNFVDFIRAVFPGLRTVPDALQDLNRYALHKWLDE